MSIITEAMRRAAQQRGAGNAGAAAAARRPRTRVPPPGAAPASEVQSRFQSVELDVARLREKKVLTHHEDRPARRGYKILRTRLLQRLEASQARSFAVTGPDTGAGKTLTAVNLAIALAQEPNTWVFLVDLDLQRPKVAETLGMAPSAGLSDFLQGAASFDSIVYNPVGLERLAVVPNARAVEQSSELLTSSRMHEFMEAIEADAPKRVIVYDAPPLLVSDDVIGVAPQLDGILLVASEGYTPRQSLEQARDLLSEMNVLGVVLNRASERDDSPYY